MLEYNGVNMKLFLTLAVIEILADPDLYCTVLEQRPWRATDLKKFLIKINLDSSVVYGPVTYMRGGDDILRIDGKSS